MTRIASSCRARRCLPRSGRAIRPALRDDTVGAARRFPAIHNGAVPQPGFLFLKPGFVFSGDPMAVETFLAAEERQRLLAQFAEIAALAGGLAHEIKNPL